jgi:hypothetical protein
MTAFAVFFLLKNDLLFCLLFCFAGIFLEIASLFAGIFLDPGATNLAGGGGANFELTLFTTKGFSLSVSFEERTFVLGVELETIVLVVGLASFAVESTKGFKLAKGMVPGAY